MIKFLVSALIFLFLISPINKTFVFCKMSKDKSCNCLGKHKKHNCCKIVKIYKDINIFFKELNLNIQKNFRVFSFFINEIISENIGKSFLYLKIKSPPIYFKTLQLLI